MTTKVQPRSEAMRKKANLAKEEETPPPTPTPVPPAEEEQPEQEMSEEEKLRERQKRRSQLEEYFKNPKAKIIPPTPVVGGA